MVGCGCLCVCVRIRATATSSSNRYSAGHTFECVTGARAAYACGGDVFYLPIREQRCDLCETKWGRPDQRYNELCVLTRIEAQKLVPAVAATIVSAAARLSGAHCGCTSVCVCSLLATGPFTRSLDNTLTHAHVEISSANFT